MALYIPHSIFHLARLLYVRPETFGPYYLPAEYVHISEIHVYQLTLVYTLIQFHIYNFIVRDENFVACSILLLKEYLMICKNIENVSKYKNSYAHTWICSCILVVFWQQCWDDIRAVPKRVASSTFEFLHQCRWGLLSSGIRSLSQLRLTPYIYVSAWCWHSLYSTIFEAEDITLLEKLGFD